MNQIVLINIEWNSINGCIFKLLTIELNKPNIDSSLFGINFSKRFLYIDIFFFTIKVFDI